MKITYGVAVLNRGLSRIDQSRKLPMEGVHDGPPLEFLANAGERGWELCTTLPPIDGDLEVTMIFKKS